nr:MAG TPA: hypothetical protein [Caudoviricetes sp.]
MIFQIPLCPPLLIDNHKFYYCLTLFFKYLYIKFFALENCLPTKT